ncbi:MAG: response regulator, partial [Anaerolineales bacterium]|nr:response regulator [Anaerolineales bacterium]
MAENPNNVDMQPYVLLIEHDPELRKIMEISLEQAGVRVEAVSRYANALQILQQEPPDVFVIDFDLMKGDPGKLITAYRQNPEDNVGV